jgi:enediyne biosynthesis protein E4
MAHAGGTREMSSEFSRRALLAGLSSQLLGQGIAVRGVRPSPRGKPSGIPFLAQFTDVAADAGLHFPVIYGDTDKADYIVETTGCGVAFVDYDNDGWLDILVLNGSRLSGAPADTSNRLYRNNRDGTFADVTRQAGLFRTGWASAITVGDFDNDGNDDLFITYRGQNILYRNNGDGTFTDVTKTAGLLQEGTHWGSGCTFVDYNRDGHLDLFIANYLEFDMASTPKPGDNGNCSYRGAPVMCGPRGLTPASRHFLYRNNGDGTFTDVSEAAGIARATGSFAMTAVAADFDNDGWPDIFIASDSSPSFFFRNNRDGTFSEEALGRGLALSEDGTVQAGMGVGLGDFNLDGNTDLLKTHFQDDTHDLYLNDGKGNFDIVTSGAGLRVETRYVGWGAGIVELDNDGLPDIFIVTGSPYPGLADVPYKTPRLIFRNLGDGKFEELIEEAGPGIAAPHSSRGCAFGDFDNDGDLDVVIVNMNEPPSLLRNDLQKGAEPRHWLKVKLIGTKSNRSGIGSRVTVRYGNLQQAQEVVAQSSYYSVNDFRLHFGLGNIDQVRVSVRWISGRVDDFGTVPADRLIVIREGEGIIRSEPMPAVRRGPSR